MLPRHLLVTNLRSFLPPIVSVFKLRIKYHHFRAPVKLTCAALSHQAKWGLPEKPFIRMPQNFEVLPVSMVPPPPCLWNGKDSTTWERRCDIWPPPKCIGMWKYFLIRSVQVEARASLPLQSFEVLEPHWCTDASSFVFKPSAVRNLNPLLSSVTLIFCPTAPEQFTVCKKSPPVNTRHYPEESVGRNNTFWAA